MILLKKLINYNKKTKYTFYTIVIASFIILLFSKPNPNTNVEKTTPDGMSTSNIANNMKSNEDQENNIISNTVSKQSDEDDTKDDEKPYVEGGLTKKDVKTLKLDDKIAKLISGVLKIVNEERKKGGLNPVTTNVELTKCATKRSEELVKAFSHTRPDGTSCFTILDQEKVPHGACGENISAGYPTAESVMEGWMNSEGHRANIMNPTFTKIGIGLYKTSHPNGYHWTQIFTS